MRSYRTLAQVFERSETETDFGGRTVAWAPLGELWLALERPRRRDDAPADSEPITTETCVAESRADPRIEAGQRVDCEGAEWRLERVDRDGPRPGRMTLILRREIP